MTISLDRLKNIFPDFFGYMTGVRDATNATIAAYSHDIDMYLEFLANRPDKKTDDFEINEHTMRGFAIFLRARKNTSSTIQRRLDGVSAFWRYLHLFHGFNEPKSVKDCGIRLKNKRNPTNSIPRNDYFIFMEAVNVDLRKIQ